MDLGTPGSYLTLEKGTPVLSSDGEQIGHVAHVLADADADVFDGIVIAGGGKHRFADAPEVQEIFENGVVLTLDRAAAERLPEPSANPATLETNADDTVPD